VRYAIRHVTHYRYGDSVSNSQHDLHVLPREMPGQRCLSAKLEVRPTPIVCRERVDYFGNRATHVVLATPHTEMIATAVSVVEVARRSAPTPDDDVAWEEAAREVAAPGDDLYVQEMRFPSPFVEPWADIRAYACRSFSPGRPLLSACVDLMARIHGELTYDPRATTVATPLVEVFEKRRGVCQDFAHLMIACLRALGLSARYVSGYLMTLPPPGQPRLQGADASHAWLAVHSPRFGFVDLDPTNNCLVGDSHIVLAVGRDFGDVTPLRGVIHGGGRHDLHVAVDVIPQPELASV
jgi:transglutaminase-like putative cysteine protease